MSRLTMFEAGDLRESADWVAGQPEVVFLADLGGVSTWSGVPPRTSANPAAAIDALRAAGALPGLR